MNMHAGPVAQPDVAIRAKPPSPKRLSRKVLLACALVAGSVVAFALVMGLSERPGRRGGADQAAVAAAGGPPESIQSASSQYEAHDLPRGGGADEADLLVAEGGAGLAPPQDPIWAGAPGAAGPSGQAGAPPPDPQVIARTSPILFGEHRANENAPTDSDRLNSELMPPRSRYEIQAGQVIPAALVTALNSDLPGRVIAQVTAPVHDSVSGDHLLIPQGARLIGTYDNGANYGDQRLLLVWNRLILPNGWSIDLQGMEASDPSGASGLRDRTDNHLGRLAGAIGLSAIISVVANESEDSEGGSLTQSVGDAAAQQAAQTGARIVDRELAVRPTLRVRAGAPVRVLVTRDIVGLRPYANDGHSP